MSFGYINMLMVGGEMIRRCQPTTSVEPAENKIRQPVIVIIKNWLPDDYMVEVAGVEPASENTPLTYLHA